MGAQIESLPQIAKPTIEQVLEAFLVGQRKRLKPGTMAKYEQVISLLKSHLDGYAHEGLSKVENSFFERHYEAEEDEHREFCQIFGPEKIIENVGSFFGYFMIRKVMAGADLKRSSGSVVKKLSKWLAEKGYVSEESAEEGAEWGSESARNLPKAEKAGEALSRSIKPLSLHPNEIPGEDWIEYDQHSIEKIEPGKLWLEVDGIGEEPITIGPLLVTKKATELLQDGWEIGCSLARIKGKWRIVEVGEIYP